MTLCVVPCQTLQRKFWVCTFLYISIVNGSQPFVQFLFTTVQNYLMTYTLAYSKDVVRLYALGLDLIMSRYQ